MSSNQLTREAYDRLSAELEELTTVGRTKIAQAIETARALGDLSENGDYHAAKDEQGRMEARIRQLEALLKNPEIVEQRSTSEVAVGSIVTIRFEGEDETERYVVGNMAESQGDLHAVSPDSPLGGALIGKSAGHTVEYEAPNGAQLKVEIVEVGG